MPNDKDRLVRAPSVVAIAPDVEIEPEQQFGMSDEDACKMFAELKLLYAESQRITKPIAEMRGRILEPLNTRILAIEGQLNTHALIMQSSVITPDGSAVYVNDYVRSSYRKADIEKFADGHPDIADELRALKTEKWVDARVSIKLK